MLEQRFNLRWYLWALAAASWAYAWLGRWEDAVGEGQKALRVGEEFADHSVISFAAWILSMVYTSKGDLGQALEHAGTGSPESPDACGQGVGSGHPRLGLVPDGRATQRGGDPGPGGLDASRCTLCLRASFLRCFSAKATGWLGSMTKPPKPSKNSWTCQASRHAISGRAQRTASWARSPCTPT